MKNSFLKVLCFVFALMLLSCSKEKEISVTSVSINPESVSVEVGETIQLRATILPSDASDKSLTWSSSNQTVATITSSGLVTAITEGTSIITALSGGKSAKCTVTVKKSFVAVTSLSLNKTELSLEKGKAEKLIAIVKPDDATEKNVNWSSSNPSIASVDEKGNVSAVARGEATIIAKAGEQEATCNVIVFVQVESISLNKQSLLLLVGENEQLMATVLPEDASDKTISWVSTNPAVATVEDGLVTALSAGSTVITAESGGYTSECTINVLDSGDDGGITLSVGSLAPDSPTIHFEGGSDIIPVNGPSFWIANVIDGSNWCNISQSGSLLSITTSQNNTSQIRKADILIASGHQKQYVEIYQVPQVRRIIPDKTRRIRLSQTVHHEDRQMSKIWIMLPYPETCDYQTISNLVFSDGGKVEVSKEGFLKYFSFIFRPTERTGTVNATIEYTATTNYVEVDFSKITRYFEYDKSTPEYKRYTGISEIDGARYIDPENPTLGIVADGFWQETDGDIVEYCRMCYDYVATAFEYLSGGNGIVEDIIKNGGGDCGNISDLYLSMIRRKGIPARSLVMTQPHNGCHVRTEFYLAGYGWIPVDPTYHMSGSDEFGKYTDNWVVSNHELVSTVGIDEDEWKISILQGCNWWWWCWSDGGEVTGEYDLSEVLNSLNAK